MAPETSAALTYAFWIMLSLFGMISVIQCIPYTFWAYCYLKNKNDPWAISEAWVTQIIIKETHDCLVINRSYFLIDYEFLDERPAISQHYIHRIVNAFIGDHVIPKEIISLCEQYALQSFVFYYGPFHATFKAYTWTAEQGQMIKLEYNHKYPETDVCLPGRNAKRRYAESMAGTAIYLWFATVSFIVAGILQPVGFGWAVLPVAIVLWLLSYQPMHELLSGLGSDDFAVGVNNWKWCRQQRQQQPVHWYKTNDLTMTSDHERDEDGPSLHLSCAEHTEYKTGYLRIEQTDEEDLDLHDNPHETASVLIA